MKNRDKLVIKKISRFELVLRQFIQIITLKVIPLGVNKDYYIQSINK